MSHLLNSGMVGFGQKQTPEQIVANWTASGLLDGISDEKIKIKTALVMEEAAQILLNIRVYVDSSVDVVAFPIIRRIVSILQEEVKDEEKKVGMIHLLTGKFVLENLGRMYPLTLEFFEKLHGNTKGYDTEAEAAAFAAKEIASLYQREFKSKNIIKDGENYYVVAKPLE